MPDASPYKTSAEAAGFLRYKSVHAFREAATARRVPCIFKGRQRLYREEDLVRCWNRPAGVNVREARRRLR